MTERAIYYFIIWQKSQSDLLQVIVQDIAKHCRACFPIGQYYTCVCRQHLTVCGVQKRKKSPMNVKTDSMQINTITINDMSHFGL